MPKKKISAKKIRQKKKVSKQKRVSKKKAIKTKDPLKTYIFFVLDRSGSMESIRAETIEHFNEQIEQIQKDSTKLETKVSLITFNHDVDVKFFNQPLSKLKPITLRSYKPGGGTAMYDAVGIAIDQAEKEIKDIAKDDVAALVVILSDGQENSSKKYTRADIAERIQRLQDTKRWTFAYLGANQDLSKIQDELNLMAGNVTAFVADVAGMKQATAMSVNSTSQYLSRRSRGITQTTDYYDSSK